MTDQEPTNQEPTGSSPDTPRIHKPAIGPWGWWRDRRKRRRADPNPLARGEPHRRTPLWKRVFSIVILVLLSIVAGLILTAVVAVLIAVIAIALQSAIGGS